MGCLFLWLLYFGQAKESNSPAGRNLQQKILIKEKS